MKTIRIGEEIHKRWKIFTSTKGIMIEDATEIALELAMKSRKGIWNKKEMPEDEKSDLIIDLCDAVVNDKDDPNRVEKVLKEYKLL